MGCSDNWRRKLYLPVLLGLLFGLVAMLYGAWHGGEMVYRHGTAVLRVQHQGATADASQPKTSESAADEQTEKKHGLEYFVPPLQLHVLLAGLSVAFALGAGAFRRGRSPRRGPRITARRTWTSSDWTRSSATTRWSRR